MCNDQVRAATPDPPTKTPVRGKLIHHEMAALYTAISGKWLIEP
jgi:hypothetical protein